MLISRRDIIQKLLDVNNEVMSLQDLKKWVEDIYFPGEFEVEDWENDNSVTCEIMGALDQISANLIIKEDILMYINFLKTPYGKFDDGYRIWNNYLESINYEARKKILKNNPLYSDFC